MSDAEDDFVEGGMSDAEEARDAADGDEEEEAADDDDDDAPSPAAAGNKAAASSSKSAASSKAPSTSGGKKASGSKRAGESSSSSAAAPAAKRAKAITGDAAAKEELTRYMRQQNRPYTALVIFENLHHAIRKPTIIKLCDELVTEGVLQSKDFKKTRLYMAKQTDDGASTPAELEALGAKEASLKERIAEQKSHNSKLDGELRLLQNQPSDDELAKQLAHYSKLVESLGAKLAAIKGNKNPLTKSDVDQVQLKFNEALKQWNKRKNAVNDLIDQMCGDEGEPKQIRERYGLETDEENGDKIADWKPLQKDVKGVVPVKAKAGRK